MKRSLGFLLAVLVVAGMAGSARAEESSDKGPGSGYTFGLALTIGEGLYVVDDTVYRGPFDLELVTSAGWRWFKFDLGIQASLESVTIAATNVGLPHFSWRPGARLTPPMLPLYLRVAVPLVIRKRSFDWGLQFGVGADIPLLPFLGLVIEVDTAVMQDLRWGDGGVPLWVRLGAAARF